MKRKKCGGKWIYPTWERAVHAALVANRARGVPLRVYDCGDHFHLTKRPSNPVVATRPGPFTPSDMARIISNRRDSA